MIDRALLLKDAYRRGYQLACQHASESESKSKSEIEKTAVLPWLTRMFPNAMRFGQKALNVGRLATTGGGPLAPHVFGKFLEPAQQALSFGTLGGAVNVLTGDPEEAWYKRFGKGYFGGAAGGLGWHYGGQLGKGLARRTSGSQWLTQRAPNLAQRLQHTVGPKGSEGVSIGDIWQGVKAGLPLKETAKQLGAYTLAGAPVAAGAWYGSVGGEQLTRPLTEQAMPTAARVTMPIAARALRAIPEGGQSWGY